MASPAAASFLAPPPCQGVGAGWLIERAEDGPSDQVLLHAVDDEDSGLWTRLRSHLSPAPRLLGDWSRQARRPPWTHALPDPAALTAGPAGTRRTRLGLLPPAGPAGTRRRASPPWPPGPPPTGPPGSSRIEGSLTLLPRRKIFFLLAGASADCGRARDRTPGEPAVSPGWPGLSCTCPSPGTQYARIRLSGCPSCGCST